MQGWQTVKATYFKHQHDNYGHGRLDPVYGWQATPGMPKLSLLVFLDGEAMDMDEFELELLGETWAYVTIALVGMEKYVFPKFIFPCLNHIKSPETCLGSPYSQDVFQCSLYPSDKQD